MNAATEGAPPGRMGVFLAGLQGGMIGVLWMLVWLGISAIWQRRSFWTSENLVAHSVFGNSGTLTGLAVYLAVYSFLGGLLALAIAGERRQVRVLLVSLCGSLGWYYLAFHVIYRSMLPLVFLLQAERPLVLGHLVYGTLLARYQKYIS
jgi:hypothetical protein